MLQAGKFTQDWALSSPPKFWRATSDNKWIRRSHWSKVRSAGLTHRKESRLSHRPQRHLKLSNFKFPGGNYLHFFFLKGNTRNDIDDYPVPNVLTILYIVNCTAKSWVLNTTQVISFVYIKEKVSGMERIYNFTSSALYSTEQTICTRFVNRGWVAR